MRHLCGKQEAGRFQPIVLATAPAPFPRARHRCQLAVFTPDGTRLVVTAKDGLRVWDLRQIRAECQKLDLDVDQPPYDAVASGKALLSLTVTVDRGDLKK